MSAPATVATIATVDLAGVPRVWVTALDPDNGLPVGNVLLTFPLDRGASLTAAVDSLARRGWSVLAEGRVGAGGRWVLDVAPAAPPAPAAAATMPAQRVAALAGHADELTHLAEIAVRSMRSDLALILLREARAVLVSELMLDRAVLNHPGARATARRHTMRVLEQRLTLEQRADLARMRVEVGAGDPLAGWVASG